MVVAEPTTKPSLRFGGAPNLAGGHIGVGAPGFLASGLEATYQTPSATRPYFTPLSANSIGASFDKLAKDVFYGSRHAQQVIRVLKGKLAGATTHSLFADAAAPHIYVALGKEIWMPALAADTASGAITDSGGLSHIPVTAVTGYVPGALFTVGAGALQECVDIADIDTVGKVLSVKQLRPATPRTSGTAIQQLDQHKFTIRGPLDDFAWDLPTATLEKNKGKQWAWLLGGSRIAKIDIKGAKEDAEVTETWVCTVDPTRLDPPGLGVTNPYTAFAPSQAERDELTRPFTIRDGFGLIPNDQAATGTSSLSRLVALTEWGISLDNHFIDKDYWNDSRFKDSYPGTVKAMINYRYDNSSGRPSDVEDYLLTEGAPPVPFHMVMRINMGTPSTPNWHGTSIFTPAMLITKAENPDQMNDMLDSVVEADVVDDKIGSDPVQIFVRNSITGAYPTS